MKVALVHDWLTGYRGGERVLDQISRIFPDAPLYTLVHKEGSTTPAIENRPIHTSFLQHLPFGVKKYRHYLPLFPLAAETLIREKYDLVISTSHAVAKSVRTNGAHHWCYLHSPMRYIWDRFDDYFGPEQVGPVASALFFRPIAWALRQYDRGTANRVGQYVANSRFVADRVQQFYDRPAEVIPPPVRVERFHALSRTPGDFFLFFSALVPYKRADHAIKACGQLGRKLVILGKGPELQKLKQLARGTETEFVEARDDATIDDYYSRARALLFPAVEDFGIVPVEATAAGLPVIGLRRGGLVDSQTDFTCQFYDRQTPEGLAEAILAFEGRTAGFDRERMRLHSLRFFAQEFGTKIRESIASFCRARKLA
jgi:glycosyltransferase involved in cell wall biosynthesis